MAPFAVLLARSTTAAIFCLACVSTLAFAQAPAPASGIQSLEGVTESPPPDEAELARRRAFDRYRLDLVAELATRNDARQLLAAAMYSPRASFGRTLADVPEELRFDSLLKRAQESGADVPIVWWMSAMEACRHGTEKPCPESAAVRRLTEIDSDNAAAWVLEFHRARREHEGDSERKALSMAARARRHDEYTWELEKLLLRAALSGPPVPVELDDHPAGLEADAIHKYYAFVTSFGVALAVALPPTEPLKETCASTNGVQPDQGLRADCAAIGRTMAAGATSVISQFVGQRVLRQMGLLSQGEEGLLRREWQWRNDQAGPMIDLMMRDSSGLDRLLHLLLESNTEIEFHRSLLRDAGKPTSPPDGWPPARPN